MSNPLYEPSFMTNSLYEFDPKDSPEFQKLMQGQSNSGNNGNYNHNSYHNYQWDHQFQQPSGSDSRDFYQNASFLNQDSRPQFYQLRPAYIVSVIIEFIQGQDKMNQVFLEQIQVISAQLTRLNSREQSNKGCASTSTERCKLPSKLEINPKGEIKAIISRDKSSGSEFPDMQEVKGTLKSETSYQDPHMPIEEETKITREAADKYLMNSEEPSIKEISYEKEPECAKSTSYILPALV
jgi:hypothetical protein